MKNTKSKDKIPTHYELSVSLKNTEKQAFSYYITANGFHKSGSTVRIILNMLYLVFGNVLIVSIQLFFNSSRIGKGFPFIYSVIAAMLLMTPYCSLLLFLNERKYRFKKSEVEKYILYNNNETISDESAAVKYSFGKKGMTVFYGDNNLPKVYEYKNAKRVIECELGIILIYDKVIFCIPGKYFDDDCACFLTERLRKCCRSVYKRTEFMDIHPKND